MSTISTTQAISLDFNQSKYVSVPAKQYDTGTRNICVTCYENGKLYNLSGSETVYIKIYVPDMGESSYRLYKDIAKISDNKIYFPIPDFVLAYNGKVSAEVILLEEDVQLATMPFNILIKASVYGDEEVIDTDGGSIIRQLETETKQYRDEAVASAESAKTSETNAKASETNAVASEKAAKVSETNAKTSETKAKTSEENASVSETNSKTSETNAKTSETNAKSSETNALASKNAAKISETNAKTSETNASSSEASAKKWSEDSYKNRVNAKESETNAAASERSAKTSKTNAKTSEENALKYSNLAESYAVGDTETRQDEDVDNAKYYYEQARRIAESFSGAMLFIASTTFANLPDLSSTTVGWQYNIEDAFTTDDRFLEGAGIEKGEGTDVVCVKNNDGNKVWNCLSGVTVHGVKGDAEETYRKGLVNITANDLGLASVATSGSYSDLNNKPISISSTEPSQTVNSIWLKEY